MKVYNQSSLKILMLLISGFAIIIISGFSSNIKSSQAEESFSSFCSIYIDNSRLNPKDGLTTAMVEKIKQINDSLSTVHSLKYVLFLSNSVNGTPVGSYSNTDAIVNKIYAGVTDFPSIVSDYEKLKQFIFAQPFSIKERMEMHYFLTDAFYKSIQGKPKNIITGLAQQLILLSDFNKEIDIYLYYSNQTNSLKENELIEEFEIYNQQRMKSSLKLHLIKV